MTKQAGVFIMATQYPESSAETVSERTGGTRGPIRDPETNPDAITGAPSSHPVGVGVGAAGGGIAGAAVGAAIGSVVPVIGTAAGGIVGAVVGATGGGLTGKGVAETINPTAEDAYWRENFASRPYYTPGASYDDYSSAYRYGWESRQQYPGKTYDQVESDLGHGWDTAKAHSELGWEKARSATRDAWTRVETSSSSVADSSGSVSTLNELVDTLKDGENGFSTSAGQVKDPKIQSLFRQLAQQRAKMTGEIQAEVRQLGGRKESDGSVSAAIHRGWINLKAALGGGDKSILNEAERGEDSAVNSYKKALATNLSPSVKAIVQRQFTQIKQAHDQVRALRDSTN